MTIRAVIDTNVIVSGFITPGGPPAQIVNSWITGDFISILSPEMFEELQDVLRRPKIAAIIFDPENLRLPYMRSSADIVFPSQTLNVCCDPHDNMFFEAAVAGRADFIVSGDKAVLAVKMEHIRVIKPAQFMQLLIDQS